MKIGIAADHGGFDLRNYLAGELRKSGHEIVDFGNVIHDPGDDYPDYVIPLTKAVAGNEVDRGVAVCGSGVGACIVANKIKNVRASLITDTFSAHQGVEDDDMNLLCLGGRITGSHLSLEIVNSFIFANFSGKERHKRRVLKIKALE